MANRGRRFGGGGRRFKPTTQWSKLTSAAQVGVAAATKVLLGGYGTLEPMTVRRTRGLMNWSSDQIAATESPVGAFGMCVVSDDAFTAGVASVPGPFSDAASDLWFVHQFLYTRFVFGDATGFHPDGGQTVDIDSSAMRKFTEEEKVALVVENGHATSGATFWFSTRLLSSITRG